MYVDLALYCDTIWYDEFVNWIWVDSRWQ